MKKILISVSIIAAVAAVVTGATTAFFSDTETSTGNTFTAGAIDLKVDSDCHYYQTNAQGEKIDVGCGPIDETGVGIGQWEETDLRDGVHKFFNFGDLKPGDWGEDTISLHVYNNDAWGKMKIRFYNDKDNTCTEPEGEAEMGGLTNTIPPTPVPGCTPNGELYSQMTFETWLDQGRTPGFQCGAIGVPGTAGCDQDLWEGDNDWQKDFEPAIPNTRVDEDEGTGRDSFFDVFVELDMAMKGLTVAESGESSICPENSDGHFNYESCHGIAFDGRLVGSTTYYVGWAWHLPKTVGNDAQTDSVTGDMVFNVEQHRNNPRPFEN